MTGEIKIEERLEQMSRRLERAEQANRAMKIWGSIAIAVLVAAGPFASNVMAKAKPKVVTASAFQSGVGRQDCRVARNGGRTTQPCIP